MGISVMMALAHTGVLVNQVSVGMAAPTDQSVQRPPHAGTATHRRWVIAAMSGSPRIENALWQPDSRLYNHLIVLPSVQLLKTGVPVAVGGVEVDRASGAGDLWMFPADQLDVARSLVRLVVLCETDLPTHLFADLPADPVIRRSHPLTIQLAGRIYELDRSNDVSARALSASLAETLRLHLIDRLTVKASPRSAGHGLNEDQRVALLDYIDRCGTGVDVRLAALAEHLGLTVSAFRRGFDATFDTTPRQFMLNRRIDRAKLLLTDTEKSITDISADMGFATPSHFSTAFRARVGMAPSRYRSMHC